MKYIIIILTLVSLLLSACTPQVEPIESNLTKIEQIGFTPDQIRSGGPPKDGIPAIDNPQFVSVKEADEWIEDNELIIVINYKSEARAYPFQILVYHEIVNEIITGDPLIITYCPLCGTAIAYHRTLDGEAVEFGVSGKLFNSNLLMYDRKTDTLWTQIDGVAVQGPLAGQELREVPVSTVSWGEWKDFNPDALVLSQDTGHSRPYGEDPYGSYYDDVYLYFSVQNEDNRIHPKTEILGLEITGSFKAYPEELIEKNGIISDTFNENSVIIIRNEDGTINATLNNEPVVIERGFWFSWFAFHPQTELYLEN